MKYLIFDIETDNLYDKVSKIHCMSYYKYNGKDYVYGETTDLNEIIDTLNSADYIIGHYIVGYDIPTIEKITGNKITSKPIDTLGLSWYLETERKKHGLQSYGEQYKLPKVAIDDWQNLTTEDYLKRCKRDVQINLLLWIEQKKMLNTLYGKKFYNIVEYLNYNIEVIFEQSQNPFTLDTKLVKTSLNKVRKLIYSKMEALSEAMPNRLGKLIKTIPKVMYKQDESLSHYGQQWINYLKENNLPLDTIEVKEKPNPTSSSQIKEWLFELGWKPCTYNENVHGEKIPSLSLPFGQGLTPSVVQLIEENPVLENLKSLYMLKHRQGILVSFLNTSNKGKIVSGIRGLTRTLRWRHTSPVVNLPKVGSPYGAEIRGSLTAAKDCIMIGTDISGLEDSTKRHWLYFFDPEYVKAQMVEGFDAHLDIAVLGNLMTVEEMEFYKEFDKSEVKSDEDYIRFKKLKKIRHVAKTTNFSATYSAGYKKIAKTAGISPAEGKKLFDTYWERNWAIKKVVENIRVIKIENQKWFFNPMNRFWYPLKTEKDLFSGLNQGTGMWIFMMWVKEARLLGAKMSLGYHDEFVFMFPTNELKETKNLPHIAMENVNRNIKCNVNFSVSVDIGDNYGVCH